MTSAPIKFRTLIFGGGFIARSLTRNLRYKSDVSIVSRHHRTISALFSTVEVFPSIRDVPKSRHWDIAVFCSGPSSPTGVTSTTVDHYTSQLVDLLSLERQLGACVYISSGGAFYKPSSGSLSEQNPVDVESNYSLLHQRNELTLRQYREIPTRISLRLGNPFGPYQDPARSVGFVTQAILCAENNSALTVLGDGSTTRDFFHVQSLADFLNHLAQGKHRTVGEFNFASGSSYSLMDVINIIESVSGKQIKLDFRTGAQISRPVVNMDIQKLRTTFQHPKIIGLEEGVRLFFQELRKPLIRP